MSEIYTLSIFISIVTFILTTHITPGPTNIILLSSILNFGYKKTLPFMIANIISYPIMMGLTALGIGLFLLNNPTIMTILKTIGILYICYMAFKITTSTNSYSDNKTKHKPFTFVQGLIYPWLNPKAWIIYTSTISLYITSSEHSHLQLGIIVFLIFLSMVITTIIWSFGGILLKQLLKNESFIKKLNISMAILLLASVIPIVL